MFYLRLLLLTALLPLSASAEMLLTSSWTMNWASSYAPTGISVGQAYTITVRYNEASTPTNTFLNAPYVPVRTNWCYMSGDMQMTISIPEVGIEWSSPCYALLEEDKSVLFYSDILPNEWAPPGNYIAFALEFVQFGSGFPETGNLPTDISQLVSLPSLWISSIYSDTGFVGDFGIGKLPLDCMIGGANNNPEYYNVDPSTATLTLEQVPEPATWALAGGVLTLVTGILIRRRRIR